jgi:hypothetical protein
VTGFVFVDSWVCVYDSVYRWSRVVDVLVAKCLIALVGIEMMMMMMMEREMRGRKLRWRRR